MQNINLLIEKPQLYTKTTIPFWDDEYISKQMLDAHLNPEFEAASRTFDFIEKSVKWIGELVPASQYKEMLDLGCGPGIYAERFAKAGYQVTGIDFSKRSISYATESAREQDLDIRYIYQNYLEMDLKKEFDFAAMIYCDYGALSTEDRKTIMEKVYSHLKAGGKFLLDVFSVEKYNDFKEAQWWENCEKNGFWCKEKYIGIYGCYKYPDNVTLEQNAIITEESANVYYIWNTYFDKDKICKEAEEVGFKVKGVFGDVAGGEYSDGSPTIAILLEK